MGTRHLLVIVAVAGCYRGAATPSETLSNSTAQPPGVFAISAEKFGPLDAHSKATLTAVRDAFPGYDVRPENVDNSLQFHVYTGNERLLYVVPSDDGSIFNVHATSAKISVTDRAWRVGAVFSGSAMLTACECWGPNPTCFKTGEHVAVNFDRSCDGLTDGDQRALKVLDGLPIQRVIWTPKAFIAGDSDAKQTRGTVDPCSGGARDSGDPCGGD